MSASIHSTSVALGRAQESLVRGCGLCLLSSSALLASFDYDRKTEDKGETDRLGKALAEGFVIAAQEHGEAFEAGCHVPPNAFISFLQQSMTW